MPAATPMLSAIARRDYIDKVMFGYVRGMQACVRRVLPGVIEEDVPKAVSIETAIECFAKDFGIPPEQWNVKSQSIRYQAMVKEFYADQRSARKEEGASA